MREVPYVTALPLGGVGHDCVADRDASSASLSSSRHKRLFLFWQTQSLEYRCKLRVHPQPQSLARRKPPDEPLVIDPSKLAALGQVSKRPFDDFRELPIVPAIADAVRLVGKIIADHQVISGFFTLARNPNSSTSSVAN